MNQDLEPRNPMKMKIAEMLFDESEIRWSECVRLANETQIHKLPSFSDASARMAVNAILAGLNTEVSV
jgi:hypothetical protein